MATRSPSRRAWWLLGAVLALGVWSFGIEPRWVAEREIDHAVPGWAGPPALKVAVAADWHFTKKPLWRVMTAARARQIVHAINAAKPDVILLPGDFIADRNPGDRDEGVEEEIAAVLGQLRAPLGVYAVLGNHDWWYDGARFTAALQRRGITVLENDAKRVDAGLWIVGVGDHSSGHAKPAAAMAKVPPREHALVMMHDPAAFRALPPVQGLVVGAHTHGGQVWIPGWGAPIVPGAAPRTWAYGWVDLGPNRMYVTSGLGVSILPVRFNMRPEWVLFRIAPALG